MHFRSTCIATRWCVWHELAVDDEMDEPPKRFNLDYARGFI